jgi:hypothetical protein
MNQDLEHLKLLSIFHYVVAAVAALFACIPFIHFFVGLSMVTGWLPDTGNEPPLKLFGVFFMVIAGAAILCGWAFAVCLAIAGRYLGEHQRYTFCLVMAAIACMFMPFGTVLGVFTIIVLVRPSVKELFFPDATSA